MSGTFGIVSLVRQRTTGRLFAMKQLRVFLAVLTLRKTYMLRRGQEGHVRAERDVLKSVSRMSSWEVRSGS